LIPAVNFDDSHPLTFTLLYNTSDQNKRQAIAAASMWQKNLNHAGGVKLIPAVNGGVRL
jgi:ABC-type oligopeptide transport system substrate-binding subunit